MRTSFVVLLLAFCSIASACPVEVGGDVYSKSLNGEYSIHEMLSFPDLCKDDYRATISGGKLNPYIKNSTGETLLSRLFLLGEYALISEYSDYLSPSQLSHLFDAQLLAKLRLTKVDDYYKGVLVDALLSGDRLSVEYLLGEYPELALDVNAAGVGVLSAVVRYNGKHGNKFKITDFFVANLDVNYKSTDSGVTALYEACYYDQPEDVVYLLSSGADPFILDPMGRDLLGVVGEGKSPLCGVILNKILSDAKIKQ